MDKFSPTPARINSNSRFAKFLEDNKNKIPRDVIVERVANQKDHVLQKDGIVIHAYTLSLGLYLPFNPLIREIVSRLGIAPIQLVPNCWRIMFGILALNFACKINLGWKEFCYCYVVKQTSSGFHYFCLRDKSYALVTELPNSEKGWKEELICLKGNWERAAGDTSNAVYSVPRTATCGHYSGEIKGFKPEDCEVNLRDLEKAWSFENRDWRYLLNPANRRIVNISEMSTKSRTTGSSQLDGTMEEVTFQIGSSQENDDQEVEQGEELRAGCSTQSKTTRNLSSFSSKKRKLICLGREKQIHPSHSYDSSPPLQSSSHFEHHMMPKGQIDLFKKTMSALQSSFYKNDFEKSDEVSDLFEKDIELLEEKTDEETGLEAARLVMKAGVHAMSFVNRLHGKNMMIKKLHAIIERQGREIEELKLEVKRAKMEHLKCSTAAEMENVRKVLEEVRSEVTQIKEIKSQEQNKLSPYRSLERSPSFGTGSLFSRSITRSPSYSDLFNSLMRDYEPNPGENHHQGGNSHDPHEDIEFGIETSNPPPRLCDR